MTQEDNSLTKNDLKNIFNTYYEALVNYASRFLSSIAECEDLVQDIFVDLWEKEIKFPEEAVLRAYLYKATRNKCFNVIKHNKVKGKYADSVIKSINDDNLFLKQIFEEEIVRQLYTAIEVLPERKKEIIKLSLKGLRNNEIAENMGIKEQTVKTLRSQAYKILRDQFKDIENIIYFLLFGLKS